MKTPEYTKYVLRISAGLVTQKTSYYLPEILPEIKLPLLGEIKAEPASVDLVMPTDKILVAKLRTQYKDENNELVLVYVFTRIE